MNQKKKKVFLGMSGGVDSSAAAVLLAAQGYEVEGVTMLLDPSANEDSSFVADASAVAGSLSIPFHVCDFKKEFLSGVIKPFMGEYAAGRTPNPCVLCNPLIKFGLLLDYALKNGADYIATGHYALIERCGDGSFLLKKASSAKDQSYFLCRLDQHKLAHALFPIGGMTKDEVRSFAGKAGLSTASKSDSQEICFIPDNDYAGYIKRSLHGLNYESLPGNFTDTAGRIIGTHKGIIHYTVGQRKGLGAAFGEPMYVRSIEPDSNTVILCRADERFERTLTAHSVSWISGNPPDKHFFAQIKVRSTAKPARAEIFVDGSSIRVIFDEPQICVSPGQSAVIYDGDILLGGGIIAK